MRFFGFIGTSLSYFILVFATLAVAILVLAHRGLLPDGPYNPATPFAFGDPLLGFNGAKLGYAMRNGPACKRLMGRTDGIQILPDLVQGGDSDCGIEDRVKIGAVNGVDYRDLETRCDSALRLLGWVEYDVKKRAQALGRRVARVDNQGSYSCRNMRTSNGDIGRPSLHSYAKAIDITGLRFDDGTRAAPDQGLATNQR